MTMNTYKDYYPLSGGQNHQEMASATTLEYETFIKRFKTLLQSNGLSARQFAIRIGMRSSSISRYMNGHRKPDLEYLYKFASYFNVSIDWLLGVSNEKYSLHSPDAKHIADLYTAASVTDKEVVYTLLRKYEGKI